MRTVFCFSYTYQDDSSKLTSSINPSQIDQKEINDFSWTQFISALKSKLHSPWCSTLAKILHLISFQLAND
ncbi:rCG59561 [Rattus norvegicus]|uniref:RCG59561 n=1 Tax=Rattus norvegicus TaxID=10116 RepID=A6HR89_RAT|nr:rCG59561 [Rattus norvegicus]